MNDKQSITDIDITKILRLLPHRYPFLLVDKVLSYSDKSIVGVKNVTFNEPQFMGHFPDNPIMPGVLIIEAMAQLSAILIAKDLDIESNTEVLFLSIESTKFRKIVRPGDTMEMTATILHNRIMSNKDSIWKFSAVAKVNDLVATESCFSAMVNKKKV
ncbi:MAG: 3-hydroxyacyl-ACP dehydratase FabZ [Rickettsiaceae bacterium]